MNNYNRVKSFFQNRKHRRMLIITAVLVLFCVLLNLLSASTAAVDFFVQYITNPYKKVVGTLTSFVPFSVAEWVYIAAGVYFVALIIFSIVSVIKHKSIAMFLHRLLGIVASVLAVYGGITLLWGINYYATSPLSHMDVVAEPVSVEQLYDTTVYFAQRLNETANSVPRDENGLFDVPKQDLFVQSATLYQPTQQMYPYLEWPDIPAKQMAFSWFMSEINYTGVYFAFTAEANVNDDMPGSLMPATIAHELAHLRGVAPEQDCNFLAVRACELSGIPSYTYSGWLFGFVYLSNALFTADYDLYTEVMQSVPEEALIDLAYNSYYWQQYESPAAEVANTVYEGFLQSYDQDDGLKSYGRVVDLLVAFYGEI